MEMQDFPYLGRPPSINSNNRYQQHHPSMESAAPIWQQRQVSNLDHGMLPVPQQRILLGPEVNNVTTSGMSLATGGCSSRIPAAILGSSDSMSRGSSGSIQAAQSGSAENLYDRNNGTAFVDHGDWQQFVESNASQYSLLLPPTTMASSNGLPRQSSISVGGGANEGPMVREMVGKFGGSCSMATTNSGLLSSGPSSQQRVERGVDSLAAAVKFNGAAGNHCWNSGLANDATAVVGIPNNVTVDPSRGEPSLNHGIVVAAGLATSHCLSPFTADPGFAERAARFSSFSNGNSGHTGFPSDSESGGPARTRARSVAPQPVPRNSSCPSLLQQQTVGRVISNDSSTSERTREIQSRYHGGVSISRVASFATINKDDDRALTQNYEQVEGSITSKVTLSRTVSNLMGSARNDEEGGGEILQRTASIDMSSGDRMQATSFTSEQVNSAGRVEVCSPLGDRSGANDISVKKRKSNFEERAPSNKHVGPVSALPHHDQDAKTTETEEARAKQLKRRDGKDEMRGKADRTSSETSGESSPRPTKEHIKLSSEQPKTDYIHVRARRGQATDSHSLAERVRREKISERMKFLQDLVPGCSKVTGKAVMLDEIINYVQSLQRQVEFLSMKLASVNPRLDFHQERFLGKEGDHHLASQAMLLDVETSIAYPPLQSKHRTPLQQGLEYQLHTEAAIRRSLSAMPNCPATIPRTHNFEDATPQTMWNDGDSELNSIVQMGFGNSQGMSSQRLQGHLPPAQVKVELQQSPITCL